MLLRVRNCGLQIGFESNFCLNCKFFYCPSQYSSLWIFTGPSEWQPGGRRTFVQLFFMASFIMHYGACTGCKLLKFRKSRSSFAGTGRGLFSRVSNLFSHCVYLYSAEQAAACLYKYNYTLIIKSY